MAGLISFTFDDGISKNTNRLLDILDAEKIKATFFIIGETLGKKDSSNRKALQEIHKRGHEIGNHTWNHSDLTKLSLEDVRGEIAGCSTEIRATIDQPMKYFRPPFGAINSKLKEFISGMGFKIVLWHVDARDWDLKKSKEDMLDYYHTVFTHPEKNNYIILQHDRRTDSIELIPEIAKFVREKGFKIVSLDEYYA